MGVLLADDKAWLRSALRLLLEHEANIEVLGEAGNARTLAHLMTILRPDLLFLDWKLPGLNTNGYRQQLLQSMRASQPDLFIIALTTDENDEYCRRWGVDASINKAESPDRILAVVRQAMSKLSKVKGNPAQSHRVL